MTVLPVLYDDILRDGEILGWLISTPYTYALTGSTVDEVGHLIDKVDIVIR